MIKENEVIRFGGRNCRVVKVFHLSQSAWNYAMDNGYDVGFCSYFNNRWIVFEPLKDKGAA